MGSFISDTQKASSIVANAGLEPSFRCARCAALRASACAAEFAESVAVRFRLRHFRGFISFWWRSCAGLDGRAAQTCHKRGTKRHHSPCPATVFAALNSWLLYHAFCSQFCCSHQKMRDRWQVDGSGFSQYSILIPKFRDYRSPISVFRFLP